MFFFVKQYQSNPNPKTRAEAIKAISPVINKAIGSIVPGYDSPVIRRRATIMAARSLDAFDPSKSSLNTFIYTNLMPLKRLAPQSVEPIKVPESLMMDRKLIDEAARDFFDMTGRDPTDKELADATNLNIKRIHKVKAFNTPINEGAFISQDDPSYVGSVGVHSPAEQRNIDLVFNDLSDDDKKVYSHRTGYNNTKVLENDQIAKNMGRDVKWVSQRASKIQNRINDVLGRA